MIYLMLYIYNLGTYVQCTILLYNYTQYQAI